jgi:hypothetical protein
MGDLPGSHSVAPYPHFAWLCGELRDGSSAFARLRGGREPRRATRLPRFSRMVRNRTAWATGGFHVAPEGTDRWSTPPPEGGRNRGGVCTALRSVAGGRVIYAFLFVFFLLFFSCFLPRFFAFPFRFRARGVIHGAQVAEFGTGLRSGRVIPLRTAPPRRGEQTLGRSVSDRALLVAALLSPTTR